MSAASHPSVTEELQLPKPALHVTVHALAAHPGVLLALAGQAFPHAPQFITAVRTSVSHPLAALPSQLPCPVAQVMVHMLAEQTADAPGPGGQTFPQRPQFETLFEVIVSQPLVVSPSQSP